MAERLELAFPITPCILAQRFGENIPCVRNFGLTDQLIVDGVDNTTCPAGFDKLYQHWGMPGHNGNDYRAGVQPLYAAHDGVVVEKQTVPSRGFGLGILTNEPVDLGAHGVHFAKLRYWHLKTMYVEVGDVVKKGQLIGVTNSTGYSSGNHLHFEIQPMDKDTGGHPIFTYPGPSFPAGVIAGAIDPTSFFTGEFAKDVQINSLRLSLIVLLTKLRDMLRSHA